MKTVFLGKLLNSFNACLMHSESRSAALVLDKVTTRMLKVICQPSFCFIATVRGRVCQVMIYEWFSEWMGSVSKVRFSLGKEKSIWATHNPSELSDQLKLK